MRSPKRPFFNFASKYAIALDNNFKSFKEFKNNWELSNDIINDFLVHLEKDSINVYKDSLMVDVDYIKNQIKSELAGSIWGKNESANIRLLMDNQVIQALKHFNEADAFVKSIN